ncbi:uncharacterized, partial [Tachysurus ichikawai]
SIFVFFILSKQENLLIIIMSIKQKELISYPSLCNSSEQHQKAADHRE